MNYFRIYINDFLIDLDTSENYSQTFQVNSIIDVSTRQSNFTQNIKVPKTERNVNFFNSLGIASDISRVPYVKMETVVTWKTLPIITKGWGIIKNTSDTYSLHILDGIIDFFKAIENKTIGNEIDLTEINHDKDLVSVINSFSNENYRYLITDYNGKTHFGNTNEIINIDYLIPSARVKYLWNKIFLKYGFTYLGDIFNDIDFQNLWITYPKNIDFTGILDVYLDATVDKFRARRISIFRDNEHHYAILNPYTLNSGQLNNYGYNVYGNDNLKGHFVAPITSDYIIELNGTCDVVAGGNTYNRLFILRNVQGLNPMDAYQNSSNAIEVSMVRRTNQDIYDITFKKNITLNAGESLALYLFSFPGRNELQADINFKISKIDKLQISFSDELKDLQIKDFVKEVMVYFGLTAFSDKFSNNIKFKTLKERIKNNNIIEWTEKYNKRKSENYIYGSYAKQNYFKHNYNDKESSYNDGSITVINDNLEDNKDIFKSKFFTPEKDIIDFKINNSLTLKMNNLYFWEKEINENNGTNEVKYKGKDKRFYFIRSENLDSINAEIGSELLIQQSNVTSLKIANFSNLKFSDSVLKYYSEFKKILDDSRLHEIEVNLNEIDIHNLDFDALYYFKQEQQYYLLDKLNFKENKLSVGNFVRVKYRNENDLEIPTCEVSTINSVFVITNCPVSNIIDVTIN